MKVQDFVFIGIFLGILFLQKPRVAFAAGIIALLISLPLFQLWIFFTAERLTYYAGAFLLLGLLFSLRSQAQP